MYNDLGVAWASSTLAFISIAFIPIPFVLYKVSPYPVQNTSNFQLTRSQYGATLRKNYSRHARKDL